MSVRDRRFDDIKPGRDTDKLVEEVIFGRLVEGEEVLPKAGMLRGTLPGYSTSVPDALLILQEFPEMGVWYDKSIKAFCSGPRLEGRDAWSAADTAPLAICRAALRIKDARNRGEAV